MRDYCQNWPPELKEADRLNYRAECNLNCLLSSLNRTDPEDFDQVMDKIEEARKEVFETGLKLWKLKHRYAESQ
ncbi:MAG: hypothetical protein ACI3VS_00550 [Evtepia sp.]